jgi:integrase
MKALPYSVKAWIQAPNSKGLAAVGIRYTVTGKVSSAAIGLAVPAKLWDKKQGLVSTRYDQHEQVNATIRLRCQQMAQAASSAASLDWQHVKPVFEQLVKDYASETRLSEIKRKAGIGYDIADAMDLAAAKATAEQTITDATIKLRALAKRGIIEETDATKDFDKMLAAYPAKFIIKGTGTKFKAQIDAFIIRLKAFSKAEGYALTFDAMNSEFYQLFGTWLMYKRAKDSYNNYFGANIKKLKTFLRWCEGQGKTVNPQYRDFKVLTEEKEIVYLTESEIDLLDSFRNHAACKPIWVKYIDATIFQCLTGLRYSDVMAGKWKIDKGFLKGTAKKNKGNYKIPLVLDPRIEILANQYKDGFNSFAEQNYNDEIKKIAAILFDLYNINQDVIKIYNYKFDTEFVTPDKTVDLTIPENRKPYQKAALLTSHCNRRSFCTRAIQFFTEKEVLSMIGSKSMVELRRYIKVEDDNLLAKAQRVKQAV